MSQPVGIRDDKWPIRYLTDLYLGTFSLAGRHFQEVSPDLPNVTIATACRRSCSLRTLNAPRHVESCDPLHGVVTILGGGRNALRSRL